MLFALSGALDHSAAADLIGRIAELFGDRRGRIVLDLLEVTFVRSSGIGGVVQISFDHDLRIVGAVGDVRKTFELAEADRILSFQEDLETALASFGEAG